MSYKNSLLSISLATLLVGCGSSNGNNNGSTSSTSSSGNPSSTSVVCLDINENAICEASETSENVTDWDAYGAGSTALSTSSLRVLSSNTVPLAYNGADGLILTAPAGSTSISPWMALINNEIIQNPNVNTQEEAQTYLLSALGLSAVPTTSEQEALEQVILTAITDNSDSDVNAYTILAAVSEKVIALEGISSTKIGAVEITTSDIKALGITKLETTELFTVDFSHKIEEREAMGWANAGDSAIEFLSAKNGHLVAGNTWHNALTVIDLSSKSGTFNDFSVVEGGGHNAWDTTDTYAHPIDPSPKSVDDTSGASEHAITGMAITASGEAVYINLPADSRTGEHGGNGWSLSRGLFKVPIASNGTTADIVDDPSNVTLGSTVSTSLKRVEENFTSFVLSSDDNTIVAYDENSTLHVYNNNLEEQSTAEIVNLTYFDLTQDATSIYGVFADSANTINTNYISKITTSSGVVDSTEIALDFTPTYIKLIDDTSALIASFGGRDATTATVARVNLTTGEQEESFEIQMAVSGLDISPNGDFLVAVSSDENRLIIINVESKDIQHEVSLTTSSSTVKFLSDTKLAYTKSDNETAVLNITDTGKIITVSDKLDSALSKLNASTINDSENLDEVISDLTLVSQDGSVDITWASTLSTDYLGLPNGSITRPTYGDGDATGDLTATASAIFRDDSATKSKSLDITTLEAAKVFNSPVVLPDNVTINNIATSDGSMMAVPLAYITEANDTVYGLNTYKIVDNNLSLVSENVTYDDNTSINAVGVHADYVIAVSDTEIFTVAQGDAILADVKTSTQAIQGTFTTAVFNNNNSIVGILTTADGNHTMTTYNISQAGLISLNSTIVLAMAEYSDIYGGFENNIPAISDDGSKVYLSTNNTLIMTQADETTTEFAMAGKPTYYNDRIFMYTSRGTEVISISQSLDASSVQTYDMGQNISTLQGGTINGIDYLYVSTQEQGGQAAGGTYGIYVLKIEDNGGLSSYALSQASSIGEMAISTDGRTVYTITSQRSREGTTTKLGVATGFTGMDE